VLKYLQIGNIRIENPLMLAPMAGITDPPFREIVGDFGGVGLMFSEMIPSKSLFFGNKSKSMDKVKNSFRVNTVQIAGNDPYYMAEAAKISVATGADIIDINFGCPVKKVVKGFAGSAIMKNEKLARQIMESVVKSVSAPITVKMRMGWDMNNLNAPTIAKIAEDVGVQMVTVHARTRSQMYEGKANWNFVRKVKEKVKIPVIVNGNIKDVGSMELALEESGADGVMVGRGICGKPWLFRELMQDKNFTRPGVREIGSIVLKHLNLTTEYYGNNNIALFRKHLGWYSGGIIGSAGFRNKINTIREVEEMKKEIEKFFTENFRLP
jgi:tRNA-dihydrouridine synthase B